MPSAISRRRYSYWKKRRSPLRRSAPWDPPSTSNGANCTTDGSSRDWSTTTVAASVSSTAQVRTTVNGSPTRTAPALVRHQHCSGSVSTFCARAIEAPETTRRSATTAARTIGVTCIPRKSRNHENHEKDQNTSDEPHERKPIVVQSFFVCFVFFRVFRGLRCFPQPPFGDELAEGDRRLLFVDADPQHVEIERFCLLRHLILPRPGPRREGAERLAGQDAGAPRLDVERLDPPGRD